MSAIIPPHTRAIFFDAVGTLLFPSPSAPAIYAAVARKQGLEISQEEVRRRFLQAYRVEEAVDRAAGWITSEEREVERWRRIVSETLAGVADTDACFRELFAHFSRPGGWLINPDAELLLRHLNDQGIVLGLGSNYDSRLISVLDGFPELAVLRERVVVSARIGIRKPAKEFYRELVRVSGRDPREVLFVGDDLENDYQGATAAGLQAVLCDERNRTPGISSRILSLRELLAPTCTVD